MTKRKKKTAADKAKERLRAMQDSRDIDQRLDFLAIQVLYRGTAQDGRWDVCYGCVALGLSALDSLRQQMGHEWRSFSDMDRARLIWARASRAHVS